LNLSIYSEIKEFQVYAVIQTGSKQYLVSEGSVIKVEKLGAEAGAKIDINEVLMVGGSGAPKFGSPVIDQAKVEAQVLKNGKAKKVLVYKKKRRKGYEKLCGHRQEFTEIKINKIIA